MSIGNTKSDGNKGNNFPYQHNVLKGLQAVLQDLQNLLVNTTGLATESTLQSVETNTTGLATESTLQNVDTNTTGVQRTPNLLRVSDPNDLAAFAPIYSVSVANVGSTDGVVLGSLIKPGEVFNFSADALNNYFTSFIVDGTGTELVIIYVN